MIGIVTLLKEKKKSKKEKFTITVLPGFNCNLKCKMCFNWTMPKKNQVSSQEWTRMLESLIKFKYKNKSVEVSIGGGEPLLHDCIFDIIQGRLCA